MKTLTENIHWLDKFAISTSVLCAIHCLFLPVIIAILPSISTTIFGEEAFHQMLLWLVIPVSAFAFVIGYLAHNDLWVGVTGICGLFILIATALFGHDLLGETGERMATLIGSGAIALGHLRNYILCRKIKCCKESRST